MADGRRVLFLRLAALLLLFACLSRPASAQDAEYKAFTAADPSLEVEDLKLMLLPLTKEELKAESAAWLDLLKAKVAEISARELDVRDKRKEIEEAKQAEAEAEENATAEREEGQEAAEQPEVGPEVTEATAKKEDAQRAKDETLETLNELREQRATIVRRANVVLDALESKGGEPTEQRKYVQAVSATAPAVDVSDVSATWSAIKGWLMSKEGGYRWGRNILLFLLTIIAFFILSRIAGSATRRAMKFARGSSELLRDFLTKMVRRLVFAIGLVVALATLEVPVAPFLAVIGGAALVIGLALQGTLSNFASGLMILLHRPFDVGDAISAAGVAGIVENMSILSTHLRTFDNQQMVVPNNAIWDGVITNITGLPTRRIDMVFGIGYSDDIAAAVRVLEDVLKNHELVLDEPAPNIQVHELGDSSVNLICRPWSKTSDYWTVRWDVTRTVKERFDAEGISIPFPQRDVHLYKTEDSA